MDSTPTFAPMPSPVGARDCFGEHFSAELDQVLTDWLDGLDDEVAIYPPGQRAA